MQRKKREIGIETKKVAGRESRTGRKERETGSQIGTVYRHDIGQRQKQSEYMNRERQR